MKKLITAALLLAAAAFSAGAQNLELELGARGGVGFGSDPGFYADKVTLSASGNFDGHFSFVWRQRLTRPLVGSQPLNGTDLLVLYYRTGSWVFSAGKYALENAGFEFDSHPLDLFLLSGAGSHFECYQLQVSVGRTFGDYTLMGQVARSPFASMESGELNALKAFSLCLHGTYGKSWTPLYSLNLYETAPSEYSFQFTFANRVMPARWLTAELDFTSRSAPGALSVFRDCSVIAGAYVKPWDFLEFVFKGTYERNDLWDDPLLDFGADMFRWSAGVYGYPLKDRRSVRLHLLLMNDSVNTYAQLGFTFRPRFNFDFSSRK